MRDSYPQAINIMFSDLSKTRNSFLLQIQRHSLEIINLNYKVRALLPARLRPWCRVGNFYNGVMILECSNANWMMRLRYEQNTILSVLSSQYLPSLYSINIKINPSLAIKLEDQVGNSNNAYTYIGHTCSDKPRFISAQSAKSIRNVASNSNGKLKKLLERLAKLTADSYST